MLFRKHDSKSAASNSHCDDFVANKNILLLWLKKNYIFWQWLLPKVIVIENSLQILVYHVCCLYAQKTIKGAVQLVLLLCRFHQHANRSQPNWRLGESSHVAGKSVRWLKNERLNCKKKLLNGKGENLKSCWIFVDDHNTDANLRKRSALAFHSWI